MSIEDFQWLSFEFNLITNQKERPVQVLNFKTCLKVLFCFADKYLISRSIYLKKNSESVAREKKNED